MEPQNISNLDADKLLQELKESTDKVHQLLLDEIAYLKEQHESVLMMFNDTLVFVDKLEDDLAFFKANLSLCYHGITHDA